MKAILAILASVLISGCVYEETIDFEGNRTVKKSTDPEIMKAAAVFASGYANKRINHDK